MVEKGMVLFYFHDLLATGVVESWLKSQISPRFHPSIQA